MHRAIFSIALLLAPFSASAVSLSGVWTSDCQNVGDKAEGFQSRRPVDTFGDDGRASLRVQVFEGLDCKGREWDLETIGCVYSIGESVPNLPHTRELDLTCLHLGKMHRWYEIAEVTEATLRFGQATGSLPEDRPTSLGTVYYRR